MYNQVRVQVFVVGAVICTVLTVLGRYLSHKIGGEKLGTAYSMMTAAVHFVEQVVKDLHGASGPSSLSRSRSTSCLLPRRPKTPRRRGARVPAA